MNYVVVIGVGLAICTIVIWYTYARKRYTGPKVSYGSVR